MLNQENWSKHSSGTWADHESKLDEADDEPSLGSLDRAKSQEEWHVGAHDERECAEDSGIGDLDGLDGLDEQMSLHIGDDFRMVPADAKAIREARPSLAFILDQRRRPVCGG